MTPTVLITGASRGIGLGLVLHYLDAGARVLALHRPGPVVPADLARLQASAPDRMRLIAIDIGTASSVASLSSRLSERIDILINNAGMLMDSGFARTDNLIGGGFSPSFQVNAVAPLFVARAALSNMTRGGKIATIAPIRNVPAADLLDQDALQAAKAAVIKVMQSLATDLKPAGVAVALIHPGLAVSGDDAVSRRKDADSAKAISAIIDKLTLETSGQFFEVATPASE